MNFHNRKGMLFLWPSDLHLTVHESPRGHSGRSAVGIKARRDGHGLEAELARAHGSADSEHHSSKGKC